MSEVPAPEHNEVQGRPAPTDIDLKRTDKLTETLLENHRTDYEGMFPDEKENFIAHLKEISESETSVYVRAAAKRFLENIKGD